MYLIFSLLFEVKKSYENNLMINEYEFSVFEVILQNKLLF